MSTRIKVGWATRDITPDRPVSLRGQFNLRISTRVQDPLTLTALAIEGDGSYAVIVSVDATAVDLDTVQEVRQRLAERLPDFDVYKVIFSATHTHTSPFGGGKIGLQKDEDFIDLLRERYPDYMSMAEYGALLRAALVEAICEAWENRADASLGWGYSHAVVGENRRVRYSDDHAVMYGSTAAADFSHIEGHVDHSVNLLFTYAPTGNLTGVLVNIACPSQASEGGQDFISADFWHDVREEIRRRHGAGLFVLPQCSAAGDQSPHRQIAKACEDRMLGLKYGAEKVGRPLNAALRQDIAQRLANAVDDAEPAVRQDLRETAVMAHEFHALQLPHWDVTDKEYAALQEEMAQLAQRLEAMGPDVDKLGSEYTSTQSRYAWCKRAADRYENPWPHVEREFNVLRLAEIAFVTAPFEYYLDFGDRIKGRSPAQQTFVVQLTAGGGYLPTARAAAGLSYGAVPASCQVSPAGGQVLVEEALGILEGMFKE